MERTDTLNACCSSSRTQNCLKPCLSVVHSHKNVICKDLEDLTENWLAVGISIGVGTVHFVDSLAWTGPLPLTFLDFKHARSLSMLFAPSTTSQAVGLAMEISTFDLPYSRNSSIEQQKISRPIPQFFTSYAGRMLFTPPVSTIKL